MSLKDLIKKIDWIQLKSAEKGSGTRLNDNAVAINYLKSNNKLPFPNYFKVRFGMDVLKKLNWKTNDKINALQDPDDLFSILLLKSDSSLGRILAKESNSVVHSVQFLWREATPLPNLKGSKIIPHEIYDKYIHIKLLT